MKEILALGGASPNTRIPTAQKSPRSSNSGFGLPAHEEAAHPPPPPPPFTPQK